MSPRTLLLLANAEALVSLAALVMFGVVLGSRVPWPNATSLAAPVVAAVALGALSGLIVARRARATKARRAALLPVELAAAVVVDAAKVWRHERAAGRTLGGGAGALTRWREAEDELLAATDRLLAQEQALVARATKGGA